MQSEIRSFTNINTQFRTEITKLTKTPQSSEQTLTATDLHDKLSSAETVAKNVQKSVIVKPKDKNLTRSKTKSDILSSFDSVE